MQMLIVNVSQMVTDRANIIIANTQEVTLSFD